MAIENTTSFQILYDKFYDRIENDEKFFNYYNVDIQEAKQIARIRATNYLTEALNYLSSIGKMDVDFSDYDTDFEQINFRLVPKEIVMIVELMFLIYMKRDESLLHAMRLNFTPSDLNVLSPANERTSYRNFIKDLTENVDIMIDNYKNRNRITGELKVMINYSSYSEV